MRTTYIKKVFGLVKSFLPFYLFTLLPLFMACSHIDEADRLIYVKPAAAKR